MARPKLSDKPYRPFIVLMTDELRDRLDSVTGSRKKASFVREAIIEKLEREAAIAQ